jgi:thiamine transport system substrate-binding protein
MVDAGDGGTMISRVRLEGDKSSADVLLGIDEVYINRVKEDLKWDSKATKFEWGPLSFVYKKTRVSEPPKSLDDLLDPKWKGQIVIQDPRFSSTGLGFLLWVIQEKGQDGVWDYLKKLKPQLKLVTPNWDLAYGMFKKDQAQLVLSYWTSPAYHIQEEKNLDFAAAEFTNGHYVQSEYVAYNPRTQKLGLAQRFVSFVMSREAQEELPRKNFMFPANESTPLTDAFIKIGKPTKMNKFKDPPSKEQLEKWLTRWREIFSS